NIRRFLTGIGAPRQIHGPARIGSSQSPAANDPAVTEHSQPAIGDYVGTHNAVWVGGSWYAIDGVLARGLGTLQGIVPNAVRFALRFPDIGLAYERRRVRGYLVLQQRGSLRLDVQVPASARAASLVTWVNGRRVAHSLAGRTVRFRLSGRARAPIDWAITWGRRG